MNNVIFDVEVPEEFKGKIVDILPSVPTVITSFSISNSIIAGFSCELRLKFTTKEFALQWLNEFEKKSNALYRVDSTFAENSLKIIFKRIYRCSHNTRPTSHKVKKPHCKHVNCNAKLTITIKQPGMKGSKDTYLKTHPCKIFIRHEHNHVFSSDIFSHKKPSSETEKLIKNLFLKGHSPFSSLEVFKINLQERCSEDYKIIPKCPTRKWCSDLYYNLFKREYTEPSGPELITFINNIINNYNKECGETCAMLSQDADDIVIAICSPIMKRVHKFMKSSSEIMFVDSSSNIDRYSNRIYLLMCPSAAGGLPLGIILSCSNSEKVICKGIELLKILLNQFAFFGTLSPLVIVTDDISPLRQALSYCFPKAALLLCKFHILHCMMRYLWDSKHAIHKDDRIYIYKLFQDLINCDSKDLFVSIFNFILNCDIVKKYKNFIKYIENLNLRSHEWASCYRYEYVAKFNDTNKIFQDDFRILKNKISNSTKTFNLMQMFDYLTSNLENFYQQKISDTINSREGTLKKCNYLIREIKIKNLKCIKIDNYLYKVVSEDNEYIVNTMIENCSCHVGKQGASCKHQYAVIKEFNLTTNYFIPFIDPCTKLLLCKILNANNEELNHSFHNTVNSIHVDIEANVIDANKLNNFYTNNSKTCDTVNEEIHKNKIAKEHLKLKECFELLSKKLTEEPCLFYKPIKAFNEFFDNISYDSSLISALNTFGKISSSNLPIQKENCKKRRLNDTDIALEQGKALKH